METNRMNVVVLVCLFGLSCLGCLALSVGIKIIDLEALYAGVYVFCSAIAIAMVFERFRFH